ncbi:MAG: hypothetical protein IPH12_01160 [Saprospirales bacterium]|nr:hypothetical protein [Saprospirales bacterium]
MRGTITRERVTAETKPQPDDHGTTTPAGDHLPGNVTVECEDEVPACPASPGV